MKKKLLTVLLVLTMVLSLASAAFANDTDVVAAEAASETSLLHGKAGAASAYDPAPSEVCQVGLEKNSIRIAWPIAPCWPADWAHEMQEFICYRVYENDELVWESEPYDLDAQCWNSLVFNDLPEGYTGKIRVSYIYHDEGEYEDRTEAFFGTDYTDVSTLLLKTVTVDAKDISILNVTSKTTTFKHSVSFSNIAEPVRDRYGVQFELRKYSGELVKRVDAASGTVTVNTVQNTGYKYRARTYYKDPNTGDVTYGPFSKYKYFDNPTASAKFYPSRIKVNLKQASGVKGYKIYISNKAKSGYKYSKYVKASVKSTYIYKYGNGKLKDGTNYYVKVVPILKNGVESEKYLTMYRKIVYEY